MEMSFGESPAPRIGDGVGDGCAAACMPRKEPAGTAAPQFFECFSVPKPSL